jgi:IS30 family transposase
LKCNAGPKGKYSFGYAQDMPELRKERMKKVRKLTPGLKKKIISMIQEDFSPQQIEGRLKLEKQPFVSHETIYKIIREDKKNGGTLYRHTRHQLKHRKRPVGENIPIKNRVSIDPSPEVVNLKQRFGDWEFDTIVGENGQGAILKMVEKITAFMMMKKLEHGKTHQSRRQIIDRIQRKRTFYYSRQRNRIRRPSKYR